MVESGIQVTNMKLEKIISMVGGDGEFSYQRMGVLQAYAIRRLRPLMAEAVKQISLLEQGPLHIADFGSSTGRNSISYINFSASPTDTLTKLAKIMVMSLACQRCLSPSSTCPRMISITLFNYWHQRPQMPRI